MLGKMNEDGKVVEVGLEKKRLDILDMVGNVSREKRAGSTRNFYVKQAAKLFDYIKGSDDGSVEVSLDDSLQKLEDSGFATIESREAKDQEEVLNAFENAMNNRETAIMAFYQWNPELYAMTANMNGITCVLSFEEFKDLPGMQDSKGISHYLGTALVVMINKVDREKKTILFSFRDRDRRAVLMSHDEKLSKSIKAALKRGEHPRVACRVTMVYDDEVVVTIGNSSLVGKCPISQWRKGFVRDLHAEVKRDDIVEFEVAGLPQSKRYDFVLSRINLTELLSDISKAGIKIGDIILVECKQVVADTQYPFWWGHSPLLPGIEVSGNFTDKYDVSNGRMVPGITYVCKVKKLYTDKKGQERIVVVPFEVKQEDFNKWAGYVGLVGGHKKTIKFND